MYENTRTVTLDPFPAANRKLCPKCGQWCETPKYHKGKIVEIIPCLGEFTLCEIDREHIHWACRCGHVSVTATLDSN